LRPCSFGIPAIFSFESALLRGVDDEWTLVLYNNGKQE